MDSDKKQSLPSLIIEAVAGTGHEGFLDGPLSRGRFQWLRGLCRFGDSLIVADQYTIRQVTGVVGVAEPLAAELAIGQAEFEAHAVPLLMTAVQVLPKELARLTAQYAVPNGRVTTIAGLSDKSAHVDGRALGEALFDCPNSVALDESDPLAGPRLIIGEYRCVRSLMIRTGKVTTIAGSTRSEAGHADGPGSEARFYSVYGVTVAPDGAVFVSDSATHLIRRISPSAERSVTTLIGVPLDVDAKGTRYDCSSSECFRQILKHPSAMALHMNETKLGRGVDRDVGLLYIGCADGKVHAFDLTRGEHKMYACDLRREHETVIINSVTGLAVTEDGARLFVVTEWTVHMIDTHTGACTALVQGQVGEFRAGVVSNNRETTGSFSCSMGCVIDKATRSLVMTDCTANMLVRLRGVDL